MPITRAARVPDDLWDQLVTFARVNDRTPSQEVRRALEFYVKNFDEIDRRIKAERAAESNP
jgi:predicted transcriptional regulator